MPNRILKESICASDTIDQLNAEEEVFFYRLLVNCDDYGLMDAREPVVRSRLYALRVDSVTNVDVRHRLERLQEVGLIELYEVDGHPYLHVVSWDRHQQVRAKRSRYPLPAQGQPIANSRSQNETVCKQLQADDINGNHPQSHVPVIQSNPIQSGSEINPEHGADAPRAPSPKSPRKTKEMKEPEYPGFRETWGAFKAELGTEPLTAAETGKWGNGIKQLLAAGQTCESVPRLVAHYRIRFGEIACNPMAIASNLSILLDEPPAKNGHAPPEPQYRPADTEEERAEKIRKELEWAAEHTIPPSYMRTRTNGASSHRASATSRGGFSPRSEDT